MERASGTGLPSIRRELLTRLFVPVILPDVKGEPEMPDFLKDFTWVDFRQTEPEPLERLIWGITGKREGVLRIA